MEIQHEKGEENYNFRFDLEILQYIEGKGFEYVFRHAETIESSFSETKSLFSKLQKTIEDHFKQIKGDL